MERTRNVIHPKRTVTETEFQNLMVAGWARAVARVGRGTFADIIGLSGRQLDNVFNGGSTHAKRQWDALEADPSALDDIASAFGKRIVPKDSVCIPDERASCVLVDLLKKTIEAEVDGVTDHIELLKMEDELRAARTMIDGRLERIAELRRPRAA